MKFAVHTDKAVFHIEAKTAKDAREIVLKKHGMRITKVKVVGNQPRQSGEQQ
ncbi:hypothetical protein ACVCL0_09200 [Rhodanobacter sp. UC4450_H17]